MNISEFSEYLMNILRTNIENFVDEWSKIDNKIDHIQVKKLFESFDFIIDNFQQMFGVNLKIRFEHYEHIDIKWSFAGKTYANTMIGNIQFCFIYIIFNLNNFVNEKWKNPKFKDNVIEDLDGIISHEIVHYIQGIKAKGKNPCKKYYKNKKSNPIELMADAKRISKYIFKYGTDFDKAFYEYINSEKARHYNQLIEYISEEFPSKTRKIKNRLLKYIRLYYDQYKNHY